MFTTQLLEVQSPACLGETITSNQVEVIGLPPTPTLEEAVSDPLDPVLGTEDQLHRTHGTEDLRVASQIQILAEDQLHRTHGTEEDPRPNPWNGGSVAPNPWNGGGSVGPRPNPWNGGSSGSWVGGRSTSLSGVTCSNGQVNPLSVGSAYYAGPTRMSCNNQFGAPIYHDVCTSLQQCASLMCQRYVRCTGRLSMSAA
jgi:hypothetical protein